MIFSDFHVHTAYDLGKALPADMAQAAARQHMTALGMVGHARTEFFCSYAMTPESEQAFLADMAALKNQYAGQMDVFCGIELDYFSPEPELPYDYRIGSVHYIQLEGHVVSVDSDPVQLAKDVQQYCGGDYRRLYQVYYDTVARIVDKTNADIIGHFDLVTLYNEQQQLFSMEDPAYRKAALDAVDILLEKDRIFEINSGAISRGYRKTPYPAPFLLQEIHDRGGRIMLSSDAHATNTMLFQFEESIELAKSVGFRSAWVLTRDGFREQPF